MIDTAYWEGKAVFITGHTGFKGSWLALWLHRLGARVTGYALDPPTDPSLFESAGIDSVVNGIRNDVRDGAALLEALQAHRPEVIFHMAAQSLVADAYADPAGTYATNVMGTVNLLEAARRIEEVRVIVNVTSDKCYENRADGRAHTEEDRVGGADSYSSSKACAELVTGAFRTSYFAGDSDPRLASARAGNVIGGGDWAPHRLVPDLVRSFCKEVAAPVRNPNHIRPWQHVLDVLNGYLMLAERLAGADGRSFAEAWNFGPDEDSRVPVSEIADKVAALWGSGAAWHEAEQVLGEENPRLLLDSAKARRKLDWRPRHNLNGAIELTVAWYLATAKGSDPRETTLGQIDAHMKR